MSNPKSNRPGMMESLATINSFFRTLLATVLLAAAGVAGWFGYTTFNAKDIEARKQAAELTAANEQLASVQARLQTAEEDITAKGLQLIEKDHQIDELNQNIDKLETSLTLLKVDQRLARVTVLDQGKDPNSGEEFSRVEFVELNDEGYPIDTPREFRIRGDVIYIDNWIVKFEDKYVEQADLDRGTSIVLFRRIFGEQQQPIEGFPLDEIGSRPKAYAHGGKMTDFEKKIWGDFWNIANNESAAKELGIRAAHGQALSMKVQKGKSYKIQLRASDGLSIVPENDLNAVEK
jgi:hypothetical protein